MTRKICIPMTTRGNYAKMKSVIASIVAAGDDLEAQLVVGGSAILDKYGNIIEALEDENLPVSRRIHFVVEGETPVTMAKSAGLAITEFSTAFEDLKPDVVVVIGDRFEALPISIAASYMNIPVAHVEGGEISGSIDGSIRHAITKMAHIHFPATDGARARIIKLGEDPETVYNVGCTSLDVIRTFQREPVTDFNAIQETMGVGPRLDFSQPHLVVIQHPVTTEYQQNLAHIRETLIAISRIGMNTAWIWPNMDAGSDGVSKGIRQFRERERPHYIRFFKSLPIEYYAPILQSAACIVGNSSSGIRESSFLGVPCVNIGTRQLGRERGRNVKDVDYRADAIEASIRQQIAHGCYPPDHIYGDGQSGQRIVDFLSACDLTYNKKMAF